MASNQIPSGSLDHRIMLAFLADVPKDKRRMSAKDGPSFRCAGGVLYSFNMPIMVRVADGFVAVDYNDCPTQTTRRSLTRALNFIGAKHHAIYEGADYGRFDERRANGDQYVLHIVRAEELRNIVYTFSSEFRVGRRPSLYFMARLRDDATPKEAAAKRIRHMLSSLRMYGKLSPAMGAAVAKHTKAMFAELDDIRALDAL